MKKSFQWVPNRKEKIYSGAVSLISSVCGIGYGMSHAFDITTEVSEGLVLILGPSVLTSLTFAYMTQNLENSLNDFDDKEQKPHSGVLRSAAIGGIVGLLGTGMAYGAGYTLGQFFKRIH